MTSSIKYSIISGYNPCLQHCPIGTIYLAIFNCQLFTLQMASTALLYNYFIVIMTWYNCAAALRKRWQMYSSRGLIKSIHKYYREKGLLTLSALSKFMYCFFSKCLKTLYVCVIMILVSKCHQQNLQKCEFRHNKFSKQFWRCHSCQMEKKERI